MTRQQYEVLRRAATEPPLTGEYVINKAEGTYKIWHPVEKKGKIYTTPVTGGGYVLAAYLESDYILIAMDNDGNKKWTYPPGK